MNIYAFYTREDSLCQSNGFFSLNLRKGSINSIIELLNLKKDDKVGWVGFGDGRELFSVAYMHPDVIFMGFEINPVACAVAQRVLNQIGLKNVILFEQDIMSINTHMFTHIYSTAIGGLHLYNHLHTLCTHRICMLKEMWSEIPNDAIIKTVFLSGSGERRQLYVAAPLKYLVHENV